MEDLQNIATVVDGRVTVVIGDLTQQNVDAIVNAANSTLLGGGGVDGAIHDAGGPQILQECQEIRRTKYPKGLPTGEAVITSGGNLPARNVIHTVGPIYGRNDGKDAELLAACYHNSLKLAVDHGLKRIAFPSISTGAYSYPREKAAVVVSQAVKEFLLGDSRVEEVRLVFILQRDAQVFMKNQQFTKRG